MRAEDLCRPSPAFARHWLGFLGSVVRPITILLFLLVPTWFWFDATSWFPDRHVVALDNGGTLEVLERWVSGDHLTFQYLSDVPLSERAAVERRARDILAVYAGPEADAASCTTIELVATEWCENGLCAWRDDTFMARRGDDGDWYIVERW